MRIRSSVRGAIDLARIATSLARARGAPVTDWHGGLDAALVALSGRVRLIESCTRPPEDIVRELYEAVFGEEPTSDDSSEPAGHSAASGEHRARTQRAVARWTGAIGAAP